MSDSPPELLAAKEVWAVLGIGRTYFRELLEDGRIIAPILIGKEQRWRRAELLAWIDAGCPHRDEFRWQPGIVASVAEMHALRCRQLNELTREIASLQARLDRAEKTVNVRMHAQL